MIGIGVAYRKASLTLLGGVLALSAPASFDVPVALWLVPLVIWTVVVLVAGRQQLFTWRNK